MKRPLCFRIWKKQTVRIIWHRKVRNLARTVHLAFLSTFEPRVIFWNDFRYKSLLSKRMRERYWVNLSWMIRRRKNKSNRVNLFSPSGFDSSLYRGKFRLPKSDTIVLIFLLLFLLAYIPCQIALYFSRKVSLLITMFLLWRLNPFLKSFGDSDIYSTCLLSCSCSS